MLELALSSAPYIFALLVIYGALSDLSTFRIPNFVPYGLAALFAIYTFLVWLNTPFMPSLEFRVPAWVFNVAVGLFTFIATVIFWKMGKMGGGDVKYLSAVALWAGIGSGLTFIILTSALALAFYVVVRMLRQWDFLVQASGLPGFIKRLLERAGKKELPYGFPIGIAALIVLPQIFHIGK